MALTPYLLRTDLKCGRGSISPGEKCHKGQATKAAAPARAGMRNYRKEIKAHEAEMKANNTYEWMKRTGKKMPKPGDDVGWDKLYQEWKQSPEAQKASEAWKKREKARGDRRKRNAGIAFGVGIAAGLGLAALGRKRTDAAGRACGKGYIAANKQCRQKGARPSRKAIAIGLGVAGAAALTAGGIYAYRRSQQQRRRVDPVSVKVVQPPPRPQLRGATERAALPGLTPKGLLPPAPPRLGKTRRLRANTEAAVQRAEQRIAQTAREEVRRIAQVGNTMAAAGEASGMAFKTTLRELRLRAEAARRRFEPGYRSNKPRVKATPQLPEGATPAVRIPFSPAAPLTPERVTVSRRKRRSPGKP